MTPDILFEISQTLALIGWGLLIFVPRWKSSVFIINRLILPLMFGLLYIFLILGNIFHSEGGFTSLEAIRQLFSNDALLLAGWVHYLAFDLFVGTWIVKNAQKLGIYHLWVIPCLILTFMAGPAGLIAYAGLHWYKTRRWISADEIIRIN